MSETGISAYGAYLPRRRLDRAVIASAHAWVQPGLKAHAKKGARAAASWDEDAVTLACEAARACGRAGAAEPERLVFASTTAPFRDRHNAGIIRAALDLDPATGVQDVGGGLRAGTSALIEALARPGPGAALIAAGEKRRARPASALEILSGDAGVAFAVGEAPIAAYVGHRSLAADLVDHYRGESDFDYVLEERWARDEGYFKLTPDAVTPLLEEAGVAPDAIDHFILHALNPRTAAATAKRLGVRSEAVADALVAGCGDAGAAHPLLMLADVLDRAGPGETILLVGFGQGVDALLLRTTERLTDARAAVSVQALIGDGRPEDNYLRFLSFSGQLDLDWGLRGERDNRTAQSVAYRKSRDVMGFVGGRCKACGCVQFPKSIICVNPNCRAENSQEPYRFADMSARIKSFTEDWQAHTPDPPLRYGNVEFEEGGNVFMEFADCETADLAVGAPMRMAFRVKDYDEKRGFRRYFWKAVPGDK